MANSASLLPKTVYLIMVRDALDTDILDHLHILDVSAGVNSLDALADAASVVGAREIQQQKRSRTNNNRKDRQPIPDDKKDQVGTEEEALAHHNHDH